jgi:hypothetical protein
MILQLKWLFNFSVFLEELTVDHTTMHEAEVTFPKLSSKNAVNKTFLKLPKQQNITDGGTAIEVSVICFILYDNLLTSLV